MTPRVPRMLSSTDDARAASRIEMMASMRMPCAGTGERVVAE